MESKINFDSTFEYKLIYVFRINDKEHNGCVKIGDATIHTKKTYDSFNPNCSELNFAAKNRINDYTSTAGIQYDLLYTEIAVYSKEGKTSAFRDYDVHNVLKRSGIKNKYFDTTKSQNEWFECDLETAKNAIKAVKEGKTSLNPGQTSNYKNPIVFRPEQKEAIKKTLKQFKSRKNRMLWNAKMRFGKTLSALEVVKEMPFIKTLIITHRPVVDDGWFDDFKKIFYEENNKYQYGSKNNGSKIINLINGNEPFVYFASIQDLRGSSAVGGNFDKNNEVFGVKWDFIIIDEAHEGTQTSLGKAVLQELLKGNETITKVLELSGTPFNLLSDFETENIYTWDYIMEQEAKNNWDKFHYGDSNPYSELPKMNIFTYHLEKSLPAYQDTIDKAFNFKEFFKTWTGDKLKDGKEKTIGANVGDFIHENDIKAFLDLICKEDNVANYPFSKEEYQDFFRHTLWVVPGVKEAKALSKLLKNHHIFQFFDIVNVAGDGDEEIDSSNALEALREAMTDHPENTRTITLTCGRLTTGVTVREWTAVLYLAGSYSTAASQYLQTIFRVQSPANINGKIKENCFVFDFAPDRTLKMVADSVQLSTKAGAKNVTSKNNLALFLNFCPVISIDGSNMKEYKVSELLQQLKNAYIERVQRNGFDDTHIYNEELLKLNDIELQEFDKLKTIMDGSKQAKKVNDIDINKEGYTDEELEEINKIKAKPKVELTPEEKARLEELKKIKKNRQSAISILRGISIRMPLLVYGMNIDINSDVTIDNFADLVDDISWEEFMPKGVTKEIFKRFSKYYDKDIFVGASRRIRAISNTADELEPTERVREIVNLFATFKNPDKETVLTPWRVVNMHMSDTIGGYDFFDESHENTLDEPRFVDQGDVTNDVFNKKSKILEINSKTGLYPLYVTYSLYKEFLKDIPIQNQTLANKLIIWDNVVTNNVYVICKTDMAKQITKRTLLGYRKGKINAHAFDDLIMQMKSKQDQLVKKVKTPSFWGIKEAGEMKFNAVVGNPPYQIMDGGHGSSSQAIYDKFVLTSFCLKPNFVSMIIPSRWMTGGKGLDEFRNKMLSEKRFLKLHDYMNSSECFTNAQIEGGVCYFLWGYDYCGKCEYFTHKIDKSISVVERYLSEGDDVVIRDDMAINILKKVQPFIKNKSLSELVSARNPFNIPSNVSNIVSSSPTNFKLLCRIDSLRKVLYLNDEYNFRQLNLANCYKLFVSKADGAAGQIGNPIPAKIIGKAEIGEPNEVCSETFLAIGPLKNIDEARNLQTYLSLKTTRFLIGIRKNKNMTRDTYKFVPLLTLDHMYSDIELYNLFNLSELERQYIETMIL